MFPLSKRWMMVSAVGYGVLFSLALTGGVRIAYWLCGSELSERAAGNLFLTSSLLTGALSAFLYGRDKTTKELSRFLFIRGLWLILIELTLIKFGWRFDFDHLTLPLASSS